MHPSRATWLPRAAFAALLACALLLPAHALFGFGRPNSQAPLGAVLTEASGKVELQTVGRARGPAAVRKAVGAGDRLWTGPDGRAVVVFLDGSKLRLGGNSSFALDNLSAKKADIRLDLGILEAWIKNVGGRRFRVRTPTAVASIRGTKFRVEVAAAGETIWDLFGGSLDVADNFGNRAQLDAGQRLTAGTEKGISESVVQPIPRDVRMSPEPAAQAAQGARKNQADQPAASQPRSAGPAPSEPPQEISIDTNEETVFTPAESLEPPPPNPAQELQVVSPSSP